MVNDIWPSVLQWKQLYESNTHKFLLSVGNEQWYHIALKHIHMGNEMSSALPGNKGTQQFSIFFLLLFQQIHTTNHEQWFSHDTGVKNAHST